MPKRQSTKRVESDVVQGDKSYVVIRSIPYGLVREARQKLDQKDLPAEAEEEYTHRLLTTAIQEWNWVDDDDQPIPNPGDEAFDIDALTMDEVMFLMEQITGRDKLKNSS